LKSHLFQYFHKVRAIINSFETVYWSIPNNQKIKFKKSTTEGRELFECKALQGSIAAC
jgi:hypothetical protein